MFNDPFENSSNFLEDLGMFEAAAHAPPLQLQVPTISKVLLVQDGSNQSSTAKGYADHLAARPGLTVERVDVPGSVDEFLSMIGDADAQLVLVTVPLGRDYDARHPGHLDAHIEEFLAVSPVPLLCVRAPLDGDDIERSLSQVVVPVTVHDRGADLAAGWAFAMVMPGGSIEIRGVADQAVIEEARHYARHDESHEPTFQADDVANSFLQDLASLTAAVQRLGRERSIHVRVSVEAGEFIPQLIDPAGSTSRLMVWGLQHESTAPQFHRGMDLLRASQGAVMLV